MSSSATPASVIVTPSSTVRQMVSASRLAVAFKAGPGDAKCWCRNLHLHTPQAPYTLCLTTSPTNPLCNPDPQEPLKPHSDSANTPGPEGPLEEDRYPALILEEEIFARQVKNQARASKVAKNEKHHRTPPMPKAI